jgi:hypothetical protein
MDIVVVDKWTTFEEKRGPFRAMLKLSNSQYSMSRTCGPQDVISLVIPRVGDNNILLFQ